MEIDSYNVQLFDFYLSTIMIIVVLDRVKNEEMCTASRIVRCSAGTSKSYALHLLFNMWMWYCCVLSNFFSGREWEWVRKGEKEKNTRPYENHYGNCCARSKHKLFVYSVCESSRITQIHLDMWRMGKKEIHNFATVAFFCFLPFISFFYVFLFVSFSFSILHLVLFVIILWWLYIWFA